MLRISRKGGRTKRAEIVKRGFLGLGHTSKGGSQVMRLAGGMSGWVRRVVYGAGSSSVSVAAATGASLPAPERPNRKLAA